MIEDNLSITLWQPDAPNVTVTGCPRLQNRIALRITALLQRVKITRATMSWSELRAVGVAHKILVDPRDVPHPEDARGGWSRDRWAPSGAADRGLR